MPAFVAEQKHGFVAIALDSSCSHILPSLLAPDHCPVLFVIYFGDWVRVLSHLSHVQLFATPAKSVAHQAPLSRGFPRQEYWSGLSFPSPGDQIERTVKLKFLCACVCVYVFKK